MKWIPGVRVLRGRDAGPYTSGPYKLLLHTTEGNSIDSAVAAYQRHGGWPHLTVDLAARDAVQHNPLDRAARALKNGPDPVETNRDSVIQVEMVGYASQTHTWAEEDIAWLAELLAPALDFYNIQPKAPTFYGQDAGFTLATEDAPQRFSTNKWDNYDGVLGHQHAPDCVAPDTPILCADLSWKPAGDLAVGDRLIAFEEESQDTRGRGRVGRRFLTTQVTSAQIQRRECATVVTADTKITTSLSHPWLCWDKSIHRGSRFRWIRTDDLVPDQHEILALPLGWERDDSWEAGWLAGLLDADGSLRSVPVFSVEIMGSQDVVALSTKSKTFIADRLLSHNSNQHWDPGKFPIDVFLKAWEETQMPSAQEVAEAVWAYEVWGEPAQSLLHTIDVRVEKIGNRTYRMVRDEHEPVDVEALADALREDLGEAIVQELAQKLAPNSG